MNMNKMNNYKDKMFNSTPLVGGLRSSIREPLSESSNDISGIFDKPLPGPHGKNAAFQTPPQSPSFHSRRYSLSDVGATSVYNQQSVLKNNGFQSPQHRHLSRFNSLNTSTQLDTKSPGYVGRVVRYSEEREKLMPTHQSKYGGVGVFPIVHLFKKDLPTLKRKPSRVTVRIASPELSRYNTPEHNRMLLESIVHTSSANRTSPPQHSRMQEASTRSVLDALKEISRKRIHASEDIDLIEENKRIRIDCLDSKKRNRDPDSPQQENAVSPNNRLSKKVCAMNELKASYSSSMPDTDFVEASASNKRKQTVAEISPNLKAAKQKNLVNAETQTTVTELTTTATNPEPEIPPTPPAQPAEKSPPEPAVQEIQKTKKPSPPVKVFDEKPLEMMRKNRLQVLMGTLSKDKTKRTTIEGYEARLNSLGGDPATSDEKDESKEPPRTPEKHTTPEKQLVSILSGPKKSPHKKHVTFNIPENLLSSSSSASNLSFTEMPTTNPQKFTANCSVTQTSTAIATPIVSTGVASSPVTSPTRELPKHGGDTQISTPAMEKSVVVPSSFASPTATVGGGGSNVQFSFGSSSPAAEPPAFKPNPAAVENITLPKSLDASSGSPGKKVGGFKFDLNKVSTSPFKAPLFGGSLKSPEGTASFSFSPKQSSFAAPTAAAATAATTGTNPLISTPAAATPAFSGAPKAVGFGVVPSTGSSSLGTTASTVSFGNPPPAYGITTSGSNSFGIAKGSSDNVFGNTSTTTTTTGAAVARTTTSFSCFDTVAPPPAFGTSTNTFGNDNVTTQSFGSNISTTTPSFGGNIATPAATPIFGATAATTSAPTFGVSSTTPSFGTATTSAPFSFGAATTTSFSGFGTTTTPSFGASATTTPSFGAAATTTPSFGVASFAAPTTAAPSFGATATPSFGTATTTAPSFGSATPTTTPSFGASSFTTTAPPAYGSFGNTATTTSAFAASTTAPPAFGANFGAVPSATTTTSAPSFGGFNSTSTPKPFTFGNSNTPSFGGGSSSSITNPTFGTTVTSASNFGTQSTSSFTRPAMSTPSFNFGSTSSTSTTTAAAPSFGTTNMFNSGTNPSFGANNTKTPPAFGAASAATTGFGNASGTSFGNGANASSSSFSGFGGVAPTPTPTTTAENKFGLAAAPFLFGSATTSFNGGSSAFGTPTTTSAFGSAPTTAPSFGQTAPPTPSFGTAVTTTSTFGVPTSTPSFTATANGFGGSTTFGSGTTANPGFGSTGTFAAPAPPSGFGSGNASFGFGSTTPSTNFGKTENGTGGGAFGQGGQGFGSATSAFNAPTTTQSGVFAFGSTSNPPKPGAIFSFGSGEPPKPSFNFTGGGGAAAGSGTTFGGSNSSAPNFAPPGGFGGTPTPGQFGGAPQPGPPGMFSIGTGSSTPNRARTQLKAKRRT